LNETTSSLCALQLKLLSVFVEGMEICLAVLVLALRRRAGSSGEHSNINLIPLFDGPQLP
jgi:hypothetical protein